MAAQTELDSAGERSTKLECATARKIENKSSSMLSLRLVAGAVTVILILLYY